MAFLAKTQMSVGQQCSKATLLSLQEAMPTLPFHVCSPLGIPGASMPESPSNTQLWRGLGENAIQLAAEPFPGTRTLGVHLRGCSRRGSLTC